MSDLSSSRRSAISLTLSVFAGVALGALVGWRLSRDGDWFAAAVAFALTLVTFAFIGSPATSRRHRLSWATYWVLLFGFALTQTVGYPRGSANGKEDGAFTLFFLVSAVIIKNRRRLEPLVPMIARLLGEPRPKEAEQSTTRDGHGLGS
jgi:CDP-diglyceride synthetase